MEYRVISEFIDHDDSHYLKGDVYTGDEERVGFLLGGKGKHSFIALEEEKKVVAKAKKTTKD